MKELDRDKTNYRIPSDFGRTHPEMHYWIFGPILIAQLVWSFYAHSRSGLPVAQLILVGMLGWTLLEYVLHRFSFHSRSEHPLIRPFNSGLHWLHHQDPPNIHYVGAPLLLALPVYTLACFAFRAISGSTEVAVLVASGLVIGFLFYEFTHYTAHLRSPKTRIMKSLKRYHMLHHFTDEHNLFGVTSPLWDWVFGTLPPRSKRTRNTKSN